MSALNLYEAYTQVYDDSELEFDDILLDKDLDLFLEMDDDTLNDIVEEVIEELLEENEIEDVESIFEDVLCEARYDMAARAKARKEYMKSSEKAAKAARKASDDVVRKEKRAAAVKRVKGAVKSALGKAKDAVKSGVDKAKEAGRSAKFHAVDKHVASYANKRGLHSAPGMAARSKDPEKRRSLRSKVVGDLSNRAQSAMRSASNKAQSGLRSAGSAVKSAATSAGKKAVGKAARGVAGAAKGVAKRSKRLAYAMGEEVDIFDVIEEHLIEEGYAETSEAAQVIMVNMSEDWREDILDEAKADPKDPDSKMDVRGRRHVEKTQGTKGVENYDKNPPHTRGMWVGAERARMHKARRGVKK